MDATATEKRMENVREAGDKESLFLLFPTPHTYTCIKELTFHSTFTRCLAAVEFNLFFIDVTTCSKKKCTHKKAINVSR